MPDRKALGSAPCQARVPRRALPTTMNPPIDPVATMPVSALLGLVFVERSASEALLELPLRPELLQGQGRVHGGILATLADTAAVWLLLPQVAEGHTLTSIEFKLLVELARQPGEAVSREQLSDAVQAGSYRPLDRTVDVQVGRLRRRLGQVAPGSDWIETVRGEGYAFVPRGNVQPGVEIDAARTV